MQIRWVKLPKKNGRVREALRRKFPGSAGSSIRQPPLQIELLDGVTWPVWLDLRAGSMKDECQRTLADGKYRAIPTAGGFDFSSSRAR